MNLKERINKELTEAMKNKNAIKVSTLRFLRSEIHNKEIDLKHELEYPDVIEVIASSIKKRKESIDQFRKGEREDLVQKEAQEMRILESFLPPPLSEEEVKDFIQQALTDTGASSPKEMGKVMARVMPQIKGRFDGKRASVLVREILSRAEQKER